MNLDEFNAFCKDLPCSTHVVQWGNSDVWKVGDKVFAIGNIGKEGHPAFTFKTSEQNYYFLEERPGYRPAPYLASRGMKWIQQYNCASDEDEALTYYLTASHKLVSLGLTKKKQKELGLNQP
ncbi:MmcQ/YjbR family DNA-binding protein [Alteromonas gracilis]|uniref:MmcQ/YjbR family DNA-binding protein n=1 Tax=Alteromonas gracilis TaxID=1479524 RepID=UPI003735874F